MESTIPQRRRLTLRLSPNGRKQVEHARGLKGWRNDDQRWLKAATEIANSEPPRDWIAFWKLNPDNFSPARSTLKDRFLRQKNIQREFFIALCQAVGVRWESAIDFENSAEGEPPQVADFFGRKTILDRLQKWLLDRANCQLILLHGRAGIGKTEIANRLIQIPAIIHNFRTPIWLSIESAIPLAELIDRLIHHLSEGKAEHGNLTDLLGYLKTDRHLIVLDQWETILDGSTIDRYRSGYENYQDLLKSIGNKHQSCLLILSREKLQLGKSAKILEIGGLNYHEDRDFLEAEGLIGTDTELQQFIEIYHNPSILKLVADRVRILRGGKVSTFVTEDPTVYVNNDTVQIITSEFRQLGELEQSIVYWLAIWRNPISDRELYDSFGKDWSRSIVDEALYSIIVKRSFVKTNPQLEYYLEPVTLKEIVNLFVRKVVRELIKAIDKQDPSHLKLIVSHKLIIGDDRDINQQQMRRIVRSIIEQLLQKFQPQILRHKLEQMKSKIDQGYSGDNLEILLGSIDLYFAR
jgi:DNA polymerase III delta prime subunit